MLPTLTPRDAAARGPFGSPQPGSSPETFFLACFFFFSPLFTPSHSASQPPPSPHSAAQCRSQPRFWAIWRERALTPLSSVVWRLCRAAEEQREGKGQYLLPFLPIPGIQKPRRERQHALPLWVSMQRAMFVSAYMHILAHVFMQRASATQSQERDRSGTADRLSENSLSS